MFICLNFNLIVNIQFKKIKIKKYLYTTFIVFIKIKFIQFFKKLLSINVN